jgi:putative spermidine/putrescine transport system ATP-binding protein
MSYIQFQNIHKCFGSNEVLKDINLSVERGQLVTLLGPSGCGKSTLLRCLAGLEEVTSGKILLDGENITHKSPKERKIGMVFQQYSLFPNLSVYENIAFGLKMKKMPKDQIEKRVKEMVLMVDLSGKEREYPHQLSGGQQQRVALARSIATEPRVLLLDEPLSAIDAKLRKELQKRIREINKAFGITTVFVTHDQDEAMILSDVIHLFHDGKIEQSGNPTELYTSPKTKFAASFIGSYNILSGSDFAKIIGRERNAQKSFAIRPETFAISLSPLPQSEDSYRFEATVESHISHGNVLRYTLLTNGVAFYVDVLFRSFQLFESGQKLCISVEKKNCLEVKSL